MRKISIFVMIILTLFISGCDKKKTLICTKSEDTTGMTITTTSTTKFVNDSISNIEMNMTLNLDNSYVKYANTIKNSLEQQYKSYKNEKGVSYNTTVKNDVINFVLLIDNKKISSDTRSKLKLSGSESYDANKKILEKDGYTCK